MPRRPGSSRAGNDEAPARATFQGGLGHVGTDAPVIPVDGEGPRRRVRLRPFALEIVAVTNARFAAFAAATGHVTTSERMGWSHVFAGLLDDPMRGAEVRGLPWWRRIEGASWRLPEGPGSSLEGRADHPVVQVSWDDALAFSSWAGGRLPREAEWERAARGSLADPRFPWGDEEPTDEAIRCNIWQGTFPTHNTCADGFFGAAPVDFGSPNSAGLYNLAGNVWEWSADPWRDRSASPGAAARNAAFRANRYKLLKGGSFLCHRSYCYRYRISARCGLSADSATSNQGFRVAYDSD